MASNLTSHLSHVDLSDIRDAVPTLDLFAIRSLRRAGFQIVRQDLGSQEDSDAQSGHKSDRETVPQSVNSAA